MLNSIEINKTELARLVKAIRQERGISQVTLAKELGVNQNWLSRLEMGKAGIYPGDPMDRVDKLAEILGFSIPYEDIVPVSESRNLPALREIAQDVAANPADIELDVIHHCSQQVQRLSDGKAISRVLDYLHARYAEK